MLKGLDAELAARLAGIEYSPIAVVGFGYRRPEHPMDGFGLLTTSAAGLPILGALWDSSIFPDRAPEGAKSLRVMIGGQRQTHGQIPVSHLLGKRDIFGHHRLQPLTGCRFAVQHILQVMGHLVKGRRQLSNFIFTADGHTRGEFTLAAGRLGTGGVSGSRRILRGRGCDPMAGACRLTASTPLAPRFVFCNVPVNGLSMVNA